MNRRPVARPLALVVLLLGALATAGCADDPRPPVSPFPGTWALDAKATADRMKDLGQDPDVAAIEASKMTMEVRSDGTYRVNADGAVKATGTWKGTKTELTLSAKTEDGKPVEGARDRTAVLHEGSLLFEVSSTTQPMVMRKR